MEAGLFDAVHYIALRDDGMLEGHDMPLSAVLDRP